MREKILLRYKTLTVHRNLGWNGSDRREERTMIAKLLSRLSFTRRYGAYGAHEWDAYAGDD